MRKYEIIYTITNGLPQNKIVVQAKNHTKAVEQFKAIMELSGIKLSAYFINEVTYLK